MSKQVYRDHFIEVERDINSGLHSVRHWPVDGDKKEDSVVRGGYVGANYARQRAEWMIDQHYRDLAQLGETNE